MKIRALWGTSLVRVALISLMSHPSVCQAQTWDGTMVRYGTMHAAIGQQQHQGRVGLGQLVEQAHFFGLGALAGLEGEVTIADSRITVTTVDAAGRPRSGNDAAPSNSATMLAGAYVPAWTEQTLAVTVGPDDYDAFIADAAASAGIKTSTPFVFTVEGEFTGVKLHVINGACPLHAKRNKTDIPSEQQPYETELDNVRGTLVGIFAKNAAGKLTHPGTSTHTHVLFQHDTSAQTMTGHVERVTLREGAVLRLPKLPAD